TGLFFGGLSLWWLLVQAPSATPDQRSIFAAVYGLIALWGAFWGYQTAQEWGGSRSVFGKAILCFAGGLLSQEFGQLAYSYYAYVLHVEIPYPSIGDLGFFGSIPLYIFGMLLLAKAVRAQLGSSTLKNRIQVILYPVLLLSASYYLFLRGYELNLSEPIKTLIDLGNPFGQAIYISLALLVYVLSFKYLGGIMRSRIFLLLIAFLLQYLADFTFLYQNSIGTWEGGRINDYIYLTAYTMMTLAVLELRLVNQRLRKSK
ncbi:hypothetical protein KBD71_04680, partial [Candidatus Woesebacteria bacterium]|nr:hypothetical protein [Candidatus Woesebacteria bacterium]